MKIYYTSTHEWVKLEAEISTVGISQYLTQKIGDVTYVDLPKAGSPVKKNQPLCLIEALKASIEINSPLDGTVLEANRALEDNPMLINQSPETEGWIVKIKTSTIDNQNLMDQETYAAYIKKLQ